MATRSSQQEQDAIEWQTAPISLGEVGLDLRQPSNPPSLSKLINARFLDERTVQRRRGHLGQTLQDASAWPTFLDGSGNGVSSPINSTGWVYGHGQLIDQSGVLASGNMHIPVAGRGGATFRYGDSDVVWTGDRLLVCRDGDTALGASAFWNTGNSTTKLSYGMPAYLPTQTDTLAADTIAGTYVDTCLTETLRVVVGSGNSALTAWITDRTTGALLNKSSLGSDGDPGDIRVFLSGSTIVCVWRELGTANMYINYWTGSTWHGASLIDAEVAAFDVAVAGNGFHLLWRIGAVLNIGHYIGAHAAQTPYTFRTVVNTTGANPSGACAIAAASDGQMAVVWVSNAGMTSAAGLNAVVLSRTLVAGTKVQVSAVVGDGWQGGLSVCARGNSILAGFSTPHRRYPFVIHAGNTKTVYFWEFQEYDPANVIRSDIRYNAVLASKSFLVGNEVFCWLRATNANTNFLVAGAFAPQVSGYADREEAAIEDIHDGVAGISPVHPDPLGATRFTWARLFTTGQDYAHPGNVRIGEMDFLPLPSIVQYGKSMYLSGSAVRNWDGVQLGDTGFQNYPIVTALAHSGGGSLSAGDYFFRVYAVRYNAQGERFQSAAKTSAVVTTLINERATLTIATLPDTNHSDVIFEVYRTEAGGTTFYYDGTVANSLTAATVQYISILADSTLRDRPGDPFAPGVGEISQIENWGPLGCTILAVVGDRLWGAGGQVPPGFAQFSKLKVDGSGVGFDDLEELEEVDSTGGVITSIAGYNGGVVFFERDRVLVTEDSGPNNFGSGSFPAPELSLADGAITHAGTVACQEGIAFWGVDGPRLLTAGFKVTNISTPVLALTKLMNPTGVQVDLSQQEVIWYTSSGDAVLWNYRGQVSRWAQWSGLKVAGCSASALITVDGQLLTPSDDALGDAGLPFAFEGATFEIRPETVIGGCTEVRAVGVVGAHHGEHELRLRVYYNGSPLWTDQWVWEPDTGTYLDVGTDHADQAPATVDSLLPTDHAGTYAIHKRTSRQTCRTFRVEWSDISATSATFTPYEITLELGARGGLGRVSPATFNRS